MIRSPFHKPVRPLIYRGRHVVGFACRLTMLAVILTVLNLLQAAPMADTTVEPVGWRQLKVPTNATNGLGSWIWAETTFDKQTCQLWHSLEIPRGATVSNATVRITADNGYRFLLDGREVGKGTEWRALTEYDVTRLLSAGKHTLAVVGFNDYLEAGVIFGMSVALTDGREIQIKSDESWRVVPNGEAGWETKALASANWPAATRITPRTTGPPDTRWWTDRPTDYIVVPPLKPLVLPFWQRSWFHLTLVLLFITVLMTCIYLISRLIVQNEEQKLLTVERSRIARDIHDDVGTHLTKLVLQGEVTQSTLPADSPLRQRLNTMCEDLRGVLGVMDEVLWSVNPRHDTLENFITYICDYAQMFLQNFSIQCVLEVEPDIPPLNFDLPLRRSLLLVVKEALNNAAKHSGASQVTLKISRNGHKFVVIVEDNGCGFDLNQPRQNRNGLNNFRQRMDEAGGEYVITTCPGGGCRVEFSLPLNRRSVSNWFFNRRGKAGQNRHLNASATAAPGDLAEEVKSSDL